MIVTPLDSAQLDSKEQYIFYHKMVEFAMRELIVSVQRNEICTEQEITFFQQYCDLFLYSIEAMRIKYMYDEEDNMKVDLTDSGFPNYLEFRYLVNDLDLRDQFMQKLPDIEHLKDQFLETLMKYKKPISKRQLFQAASVSYYSSVKTNFIFNRFVQGKIIEAPAISSAQYMTSWSFYDVSHNRPFICFMYFDYDGRNVDDYKEKIYAALKQSADREINIDSMAYGIDKKLDPVFPKHIKRIDLGPLHNIFAKDENELTHLILDGIGKKVIPPESYAFSMKVDEVFSGSEFKKGSFFSKQTLQKWSDPVRQRYVFAPHRIIQLLYNKTPEIINKLAKAPFEMGSLAQS